MQLRLDIAPELTARWQALIERQLGLTIEPLRARLRSARLRFARTGTPARAGLGGDGYFCELTARGLQGETYRAVARGRDGALAIADALARARRSIARRARRASTSAHPIRQRPANGPVR